MSVTPSIANLSLPEGASTTITKTVHTSAIPPNPDIVFLVDTTTSMGAVIDNVNSNIAVLLSTIRAEQPTAKFAVAMYKDTDDAENGLPFFSVVQSLTADTRAVERAINELTWLSGGGTDAPEDAINALYQVAAGAITFRPNGARIIVWIGDSSSHDPSNGHSMLDAFAALNAARIRVIALDVGPAPDPYISDGLDFVGQATFITIATGGRLFKGIQPDQVSDTILSGLHNLPVEVTPSLGSCDPELSVSWVPASRTVISGTDAIFFESVQVGSSATPGSTLVCQVDFLLNGVHQDGFLQTVKDSVPKHATVLMVSDATSDYHDAGTLSAVLTDGVTHAPIAGATVSFSMGAESGSGVTNASGAASCTIIPTEPAGTYPIQASFSGDAQHLGTTATAQYFVTLEETTLEYTGPTILENGSTITLSAVLKEDGLVPISGRTVTFTLGSGAGAQSCSGIADPSGTAYCAITVNQPLGAGTVSASFAGDAYYEASSDSEATLIFEFAAGGVFVVGDATPGIALGTPVNFWGAQWAKHNQLTGGPAPAAFKGFEDGAATIACGAPWTSRPGNSAAPPDSVPSHMGVIVSSSIRKSGPVIQGSSVHIVVVQTDPGYASNPGHPGTGKIVGVFC